MVDKARKDLLSLLDLMASLSPWADVGNAEAEPFLAAFSATRAKALAAVPAYLAAVDASRDQELTSWLGDMATLRRWADSNNPESEPFVDAFAAARARALDAAAALTR